MNYVSNLDFDIGTFIIKDEEAHIELDKINTNIIANNKNNIFRGKDITSYYTDETLYERIINGSFDDLFIGDYITANYKDINVTFRVAGFNTLYNNGENVYTKNHIVMVPDEYLTTSYMGSVSIVKGGYANSYIQTDVIGGIATNNYNNTINSNLFGIFKEHLLTTNELLTSNNDTNGIPTNTIWTECQAVLMSEVEVYGSNIFSNSGYNTGNANLQLPLFRLNPKFKNIGRYSYWLKNIASYTEFCCVSDTGISDKLNIQTDTIGVRPRFVIG